MHTLTSSPHPHERGCRDLNTGKGPTKRSTPELPAVDSFLYRTDLAGLEPRDLLLFRQALSQLLQGALHDEAATVITLLLPAASWPLHSGCFPRTSPHPTELQVHERAGWDSHTTSSSPSTAGLRAQPAASG